MKTLGEVIVVKQHLEAKLIRHPAITAMDVGASDAGTTGYSIRIFVNDPGVSYAELGISRTYEDVPVIVRYRKIVLQR